MFFAEIEFDINKTPKQNIDYYPDIEKREINFNGITSIMEEYADVPYKLTKLICFLNPEGPRKIIKRKGKKDLVDGKPEDERKCQLTKLICFLNPEGPRKILKRKNIKDKLIESHSLIARKHEEKMEYSHIEICLKFKNPGNYYIIFGGDNSVSFRFPIKVKEVNKEECVRKMFWKIDKSEKILLKEMRKSISIYVANVSEFELEDDQMTVHNEKLIDIYQDWDDVVDIYPIMNEGIYEFYLDEDGITREKVEMVKADNVIVNFENNKKENPNKKRKLF
uniref:Galectin domain-containing protein n=1 Tax=Meloidogyne hapla TaxID=6305 RepID=A0A1I8BXU1_MELHA